MAPRAHQQTWALTSGRRGTAEDQAEDVVDGEAEARERAGAGVSSAKMAAAAFPLNSRHRALCPSRARSSGHGPERPGEDREARHDAEEAAVRIVAIPPRERRREAIVFGHDYCRRRLRRRGHGLSSARACARAAREAQPWPRARRWPPRRRHCRPSPAAARPASARRRVVGSAFRRRGLGGESQPGVVPRHHAALFALQPLGVVVDSSVSDTDIDTNAAKTAREWTVNDRGWKHREVWTKRARRPARDLAIYVRSRSIFSRSWSKS